MKSKALHCGLLIGIALAASSAAASAEVAIDKVRVKKAIADRMTPAELAAYKAKLAERLARGLFDRARPAPGPSPLATAADTCPATTPELAGLPWTSAASTTVGMADDYDLPADTSNPTCAAPATCTGAGPAGSLPRGAIYTGTGTAPDRAYQLIFDSNCEITVTATPASGWDLSLIVYQANCSSDLADCACVDDTGVAGDPESVTLSAMAGTIYYVLIDGYSTAAAPPGPSGGFTLGVTGTGCTLLPVELQSFAVDR